MRLEVSVGSCSACGANEWPGGGVCMMWTGGRRKL